jgi:DNA-binding response OmpR family regulator
MVSMLKVLVVEDNIMIANMLEEILLAGGYAVCGRAHTVDEAVKLAKLHRPDLAVFDFKLADGDYSSQIVPLLQENSNMGILYASGHKLDNLLTSADGEAYIRKPYKIEDLLRALEIVHACKTGGLYTLPQPKNFCFLKESPLSI